jgi:hypothetical protein
MAACRRRSRLEKNFLNFCGGVFTFAAAVTANLFLWFAVSFSEFPGSGLSGFPGFALGLAALSFVPLTGLAVGFHCFLRERDLRCSALAGAAYGVLFSLICLAGYVVRYGFPGAPAFGGVAIMLLVGSVTGVFGGFLASYRARCKKCSLLRRAQIN